MDLAQLDLRDPDLVIRLFKEGTDASRDARCRVGSIDRIEPPGTLIATGDLHDNPVHMGRVVEAAGMGLHPTPNQHAHHLTLHELIHSDRLMNGMDMSYRALARAAALKAAYPERVHLLLANHELSQIVGAGIIKDGIRVVEAFDAGVEFAFHERAEEVEQAIDDFVRAMPLALRCVTPRFDILCAHSLPGIGMMQRFDPAVLSRDLTPADYEPRVGSAHLMVWGRGYDAEQLEDLVERWGVNMFILGHEKAENGAKLVPPNAIILNSDHDRGVYLPIDLSDPPSVSEAMMGVIPLA
ncbi:hypothetical protein [Nodularia spumigena]|uniref:hypothetical protein n=1 Tax=Nodularia spumigena TaxID=70799 RepID=UPI002B1EFBCA|nr:hypothetical protein [Nodularia spumigena]MEA5557623.1 hypothetical protein [Nodularia spumigena CH309]